MTTQIKEQLTDIPVQKSFTDIGLDNFGQSPLQFLGAEVNVKSQSLNVREVYPNFIKAGELTQKLNVVDGWIQSHNFVTGVSGWRIHSNGTSEFN